ncbi:hypothetical protein ACFZDG_39295 [Kitasatospora xanthocidica]|uniref:hypothetical protein n=1 Tax=Kitasatospora xanthocidica TaxID=83382 RepID=UPI0036E3D3A5
MTPPQPTTRPRPLRRTIASTAVVLTAFTSFGLANTTSAAAAPLPEPPNATCNPSTDTVWNDVLSTKVEAVVTDFSAINVAEGTTGQRSETLTRVDTVTTTVNKNTEIEASASFLFFKVSAKVGFNVQTTTSSTTTTTASNSWYFNKPGYYGLYRGTRKVTGEWVQYTCARAGSTGFWINTTPGGTGTYTTFEVPEQGTVSCATPEPAGTVRGAARQRLSC